MRRECLDRLLIIGRRHLHDVVATYTKHYNEHRSLGQRPPLSKRPPSDEQPLADVIDLDRIRRRDLLGGLIHDYDVAASASALRHFSERLGHARRANIQIAPNDAR